MKKSNLELKTIARKEHVKAIEKSIQWTEDGKGTYSDNMKKQDHSHPDFDICNCWKRF